MADDPAQGDSTPRHARAHAPAQSLPPLLSRQDGKRVLACGRRITVGRRQCWVPDLLRGCGPRSRWSRVRS